MKIAVITGASSGMGMETAIQLADRFGGKLDEIWLIARRRERMEVLNGHVPVSLRFFPMDITDRIQLERLKIELETIRPKVIFLVNAAGFGKIGKIGSLPLEAEMGMVVERTGAFNSHPSCASLYGKKWTYYSVCVCCRVFAAAGLCNLRSHKSLCVKLQPRPEYRVKRKGDLCYCCMPRPSKNRIF